MTRITVTINEAVELNKEYTVTFPVTLSTHISKNATSTANPCLLSESAMLSLHAELKREEQRPTKFEEIAWLLENHLTEDPLAATRATHARKFIQELGYKLKSELGLLEEEFESQGISEVVFNIQHGEYTRRLLWEVLEAPSLWKPPMRVLVRRVVVQDQGLRVLQRQPTYPSAESNLKILLLVARKPGDRIHFQLTSRPLLKMLRSNPLLKENVELTLCRPGTKGALIDALQMTDYDIVHLDVHGDINDQESYLLFQSTDPDKSEKVGAREIAAIFSRNRVKLVVINACRSAQSFSVGVRDSVAASLVQSGISCVVGMSYEISDEAVHIFHHAFYKTLLNDGSNASSAAFLARRALEAFPVRSASIAGHKIALPDYLIPVVYTNEQTQSLDQLPFAEFEHLQNEEREDQDLFIERDAEAFALENRLLQTGIAFIEAAYGMGKRQLMENLATWFKESGMISTIYRLDCFNENFNEQKCLDICIEQYRGLSSLERATKGFANHSPKSMADLLEQTPSILLLFDVGEQLQWVQSLVQKIAGNGSDQDAPSTFILISSMRDLSWLKNALPKLLAQKSSYRLGPIKSSSAIKLLTRDIDVASALSEDKSLSLGDAQVQPIVSAWWCYHQLIYLLDYNPLAIELVAKLLYTTAAEEVLWKLQIGTIALDWKQDLRLQRLNSLWDDLLFDHRSLLLILVPCNQRITRPVLRALCSTVPHGSSNTLSSFVESLVKADAATMTGRKGKYDAFLHLDLHPLFSQYIRNQNWTELQLRTIWLNMATIYHNKSLEWIQKGLFSDYVQLECLREWSNLTAVMRYLAANDIGNDTPESSLFDLIWLVCSFTAQNEGMARQQRDLFLDITFSALQQLVLDFQVTESYPWRLVFEAGMKFSASRLSEPKILRFCLMGLYLIESFYDTSEITARDYCQLMLIMLRALDLSLFDKDFSRFLETVICFCMLISNELDVEDGIMKYEDTKVDGYLEREDLPARFTEFASVWHKTHIYRSLGYYSDLNKTRSKLETLTGGLANNERAAKLDPLDDLLVAFEAINAERDIDEIKNVLSESIKKLESKLRIATAKNDSRRQLDLYDKLVELYTRREDWISVLFVLRKIDELHEDLSRLRGVRSDEASYLQRQKWMLSRRAVCLKRLGSIEESKQIVMELREVVDRREQLWTKADRNKEQFRNLTSVVQRNLAKGGKDQDKDRIREMTIGDHSFRLPRFYTDDDLDMPGDDGAKPQAKTDPHPQSNSSAVRPEDDLMPVQRIQSWSNELLGSSDRSAVAKATALPLETSPPSDLPTQQNGTTSATLETSSPPITSATEHGAEVNENLGQEYSDEYDYENTENDADDLYFILNPWMKEITKTMRKAFLGPGGGKEVSNYKDFQMPPGHVGGYFLAEGKRLISEQFLELLGVCQKAL